MTNWQKMSYRYLPISNAIQKLTADIFCDGIS
nr:MAG TPA: hypothetical protein [Caudoviricetes sp.]DAS15065.1 MAG TPA: hypothetical protein [Caudoviricetes sp.]